MSLTDEELESLLIDLESDRVERKESISGDAPKKIREAICAFANDLPDHRQTGIIFVGAKDNGEPSGIPVTDQLLLTLSDMRSDGNILPIPTMLVEKRVLAGAEIAVIVVMPADAPPVKYKGRVWIRIGPRRAIATSQDERLLNEKRRFRDLPFDLQPIVSATIKNLSPEFFQQYLANAIAPDILAENKRSFEERLAACRMIVSAEDTTPTLMGCMVMGLQPRDFIPCNYIQFLRIDGTQLEDAIQDETTIDGPLHEMLLRLDDKLESHIHTAVNIEGRTEKRRPNYPLVALQQLARNAVMHRIYEGTNAPIRIHWFNDRIEIINPGGPFGMVTKQNFGQPGITDYRNPNIAEAMKVLGYVQRFGVGIQTAQRHLQKNGNPPVRFNPQDNHILAEISLAA